MPERNSFDYAVVRVVPRVERGEFVNVGVIVFCSACKFLGARIEIDRERLAAVDPAIDFDEIARALEPIALVSAGGDGAGPIGQLPARSRFDWLVAPRSTVVQTSPVHSGLCDDPEQILEHLMETMVRLPRRGTAERAEASE